MHFTLSDQNNIVVQCIAIAMQKYLKLKYLIPNLKCLDFVDTVKLYLVCFCCIIWSEVSNILYSYSQITVILDCITLYIVFKYFVVWLVALIA